MSAAWLAHPEWLGSLSALSAAAGAALVAAALRTRARTRRLLGPSSAPAAIAVTRDGLLLAALLAIVVALLGPRIGERTLAVPGSGVDLVLLLDVSRSMDARDAPPSRFERARRAAAELLARLEPGDRAALAAFAGRGVLLTPLSADIPALEEMLPALDTELMRRRGSNLASGVQAALAAYEAASARPRVLLVLSDGEDPWHPRDVSRVAADAARAGVRVVAVAFGSERGATIPDHGVPLRGADGMPVQSRRETRRLAELSDATDGALFLADAWGAVDVGALVAALRRDAGGASGEPVLRRVPALRVTPFAALAFALLGAELALPWQALGARRRELSGSRRQRSVVSRLRGWAVRRDRARGRRAAAGALAALLALAAAQRGAPEAQDEALPDESLWLLEAQARSQSLDPVLLLHLGVARARRGQLDAAARAFSAAAAYARDPALVALAYYDLGVSALEQADLEAARDAFFDALVFTPGDRRVQFNLEWTLRALSKRAPLELPSQGEAKPSEKAPPGPQREAGETPTPYAQEPGAPAERGSEPDPSEARAGAGATAPSPDTMQGRTDASQAESGPEPARLSDAEAARWLAAVVDDPGRALREAARRAAEGEPRGASASEPAW